MLRRAAWVEGYARRAQAADRASTGRTIWLTLPAPRDRGLARVFRGVNRAIVRATREQGARLLDLVPVFTPGWRYRRDDAAGRASGSSCASSTASTWGTRA